LLRDEEKVVVRALVEAVPSLSGLLAGLDTAYVEDMSDGGMGSVRFQEKPGASNRLAREVSSATFRDFDGTQVNVALNVDQHGELFEIDFWKVDFSPLLQYPRAGELIAEQRLSDA
jgi:hypothetical protein